MKRVLVLGGYGAFGARICERLAADGRFEVVAAGRSLARAQAFCAGRPGLTPAAVDRGGDLGEAFARLAPWLVIDAAGPFQGAGYAVPRACLQARAHYLDIADGRAFVEGFSALDAEARAVGVTLISGASSTPALSSAAAFALAEGLDRVGRVESAISAANRAAVGRSVVEAILSYVGRPVALQQGGCAIPARGWRKLKRETFTAAGAAPLRGRWVALCDTPDLALLSDRLPGRPLVVFRAGVELAIQNLALWALSWPVQWGWTRSLRPLAGLFQRLRTLTAGIGGACSAMSVTVTGLAAGQVVERRWTLVADNGRGPETPCLAAPLLAARLAEGALTPGARAAVGVLPLAAFQPDFGALDLKTETRQVRAAPPLYAQVLGEAFHRLPPKVREMHEIAGAGLAEGRARVTRGAHPLARLVGWIMGFPPAAEDVAVTVRFDEQDGRETWTRRFGEAGFSSRLSRRADGRLQERFGPLSFTFALTADETGLTMPIVGWRLGPLPLPRALAPQGVAREFEADGRFHFDVPIGLPFVGPVVRYRGWLERG